MGDRLFVGVLGNRNAGKSTTWNTLFGRAVKTGKNVRWLRIGESEWVEVFLISGSPEERKISLRNVLDGQNCKIILCSIQYTRSVFQTLEYVKSNKFDVLVQWLNPGYHDVDKGDDHLGLTKWFDDAGASLVQASGKEAQPRTDDLRSSIGDWARTKELTVSRD